MNTNKDFFERVFEVTCLIPAGRVTTYGAIARCIGSPQAARMVGWALNKAVTYHKFVPAHRVVNRNGMLTGKIHFWGVDSMKQLLESEGITVDDDRVIDFDKLFWEPSVELLKII